MADPIERPSDLTMAVVVLFAITATTAALVLLSWLLGYGMGASTWGGVVIAAVMGVWYWVRNRQMRREDL
ncbi:MAG: hypothetical protein WA880_05730 [Ornithinimicrobium sp.]